MRPRKLRRVAFPNSQPHPRLTLLLIFGIVLFIVGNTALLLSNPSPQTSSLGRELTRSWPATLTIAKLNLKVPIAPGGIFNGQWILSDSSAHYLPTSGKLGEGFNTIIYAHKLPHLFGNLYKLTPGDIITLSDSEGNVFYYRVLSTESIYPSEITKLRFPIRNSLTLFTCDGWYDQKRLIVRANRFDFGVSLW